jgi:hypothetical protein
MKGKKTGKAGWVGLVVVGVRRECALEAHSWSANVASTRGKPDLKTTKIQLKIGVFFARARVKKFTQKLATFLLPLVIVRRRGQTQWV